jgi:AcrR family transcriptional regulator
MSPRKYDMTKRRAAVEQTRRRIIEATMELHGEQGVLRTSWEDIAARAGVSVPTVYRHFPTLDELVPACGAASMERLALPSDEEIETLYAGAAGRRERLARLAGAAFDIYERGWHVFAAVRREGDELEPLARSGEEIEERLGALVGAALVPLEASDDQRRAVRALVDVDVWRALRAQGIEGDAARTLVTDLLDGWLRPA